MPKDPLNSHMLLMVAQQPFSPGYDTFCKLTPIAFLDDPQAPIASVDFPNDGEVWWMLTDRTAALAEPGRLLAGVLEHAVRYEEENPDSSEFQVKRDSVREPRDEEAMTIVTIAADALRDFADIIAPHFRVRLAYPPTSTVFVQWRDSYYGPLRITSSANANTARGAGKDYLLRPKSDVDPIVYRIEQSNWAQIATPLIRSVTESVSHNDMPRRKQASLSVNRQEILMGRSLERLLSRNPEILTLETLDRKLVKFAKKVLTPRAKRQQFQALLEELRILGTTQEDALDLAEAVRTKESAIAEELTAMKILAESLLESGAFGEQRLKDAEESLVQRHVEARSAEVSARIQAQTAASQKALEQLQQRLGTEEAEQRAVIQKRHEELDRSFKEHLASEKQKLDNREQELRRQEEVLKGSLAHVANELREAGDGVVNRFLTIAPLLQAIGIGAPQQSRIMGSSLVANVADGTPDPTPIYEPPITARSALRSPSALTEADFIARFVALAKGHGLHYQEGDLRRFHLSVKCGDITVLAGPSGTGKSTLPILYARALLGEEASDIHECLMVNVSPSWHDSRDLLGHLNLLERRFTPSESGLYQRLITAAEEYRLSRDTAGMHLVCLDEMNLAQVEHYFGDIMLTLGRVDGQRKIRCFAQESVGPTCPFRNWATVPLAPTLRFVGTVNFDETTRLLSDRFYDRANVIEIAPRGVPSDDGETPTTTATGPAVTLRDINAWTRQAPLESDVATLIDAIRPILEGIGLPISPRTYTGMHRFIRSAGDVMTQQQALDCQIAQRLLPRIRNVSTRSENDALQSLQDLLRSSGDGRFPESKLVLERKRRDADYDRLDFEEEV
jgi:energy-coupling factor transporter ATP-binding protein EcfA2